MYKVSYQQRIFLSDDKRTLFLLAGVADTSPNERDREISVFSDFTASDETPPKFKFPTKAISLEMIPGTQPG